MSEGSPDMTSDEAIAQAIASDKAGDLGPSLLGFAFDLLLFGFAAHQLITYFTGTSKERRSVLAVVITSALCMIGNTVFLIYYTWSLFVSGFGDYLGFNRDGYTPVTFFIVLTIAPVQLFYLQRAWMLYERKKWVLVAVCPLLQVSTLASWASGIGLFVEEVRKTMSESIHPIVYLLYTYHISVILIDVILSASIIVALRKSRSGWARTDGIVKRLIRMTIESQLPCTVFAVVNLVTMADASRSLFNLFWALWYAKVYNVTLYAVLNARLRLREPGSSGEVSGARDQTFSRSRAPGQPIPLTAIHVSTECYTESHAVPELQLRGGRRRASRDFDEISGKEDYSSTTALAPMKEHSEV